MTEECVNQKKGTYLFCDTDSLEIVSSKNGGSLNIARQEIQNAQLQENEWEYSLQRGLSFAIRTSFDPISAAS
jgi:hypothetical protein